MGLPCQVAMIKRYLKDDKFYFVDLICHGVCSRWLVEKHRKELENKYHDKLLQHQFRVKINGKGSQNSRYEFQNKIKYVSNEDDIFMRLFFPNFSLMEACYDCSYAGKERVGDITIGDFNGASKVLTELPEDSCVSVLLLNNSKAETFVDGCNIKKYEVPIEVIQKQNEPLCHSAKRPWFRSLVFLTVRIFGVKGAAFFWGGKYYLKKIFKFFLGESNFNKIKIILGRNVITQ